MCVCLLAPETTYYRNIYTLWAINPLNLLQPFFSKIPPFHTMTIFSNFCPKMNNTIENLSNTIFLHSKINRIYEIFIAYEILHCLKL